MPIRRAARSSLPVLFAIAAACTPAPTVIPADTAADRGNGTVADALAMLDRLTVVAEPPRQGYDRDGWRHWTDADGDCQNTRHEVLIAESLAPVTLRADGCAVIAGRWRDPFTGATFTDPSDLDIDHVVPLAEAHDSGAAIWSAQRREAFANDLDLDASLMAVDDAQNQRKGDRDPADWLPPDPSFHCAYAVAWVAVKSRWALSVDAVEAAALEDLLTACLESVDVALLIRAPVSSAGGGG